MRKHNGYAAEDDGVDDSLARSRVSHWLQVAGGTVGIREASGLRAASVNRFKRGRSHLSAKRGVHVKFHELRVVETVGDTAALGYSLSQLVVLLRRRVPSQAAFGSLTLGSERGPQGHCGPVTAHNVRPQVARVATWARPCWARCRKAVVRGREGESVPVPRLPPAKLLVCATVRVDILLCAPIESKVPGRLVHLQICLPRDAARRGQRRANAAAGRCMWLCARESGPRHTRVNHLAGFDTSSIMNEHTRVLCRSTSR
jgi:hypothetical protein